MSLLLRNSTQFGLANTDSFRRASKKLFGRWGGNLQNSSKLALTIYRPSRDDYSFVQADQAGAEALVVAYLAPNGKFRQLFLNGIKSHTYVAANIFTERWIKENHLIAGNITAYDIPTLKALPEWKTLAKHIKDNCDREYFIGKKSCHCLKTGTEILTTKGWIKVEDYDKNTPLAEWNIDSKKIEFKTPLAWNVFDFTGNLISFKGKTISQVVTPEHRIPYFTNNKTKVLKASELKNFPSVKIPTNGDYVGGKTKILNNEVRLICAVQADGSIDDSQKIVRFHLKKNRKVERLEEILNALSIPYIRKYSICDDSIRISFRNTDKLMYFLGNNKQFSEKLLELDRKNLECFIDEITFWDGHVTTNGSNAKYYFSSLKNNAIWVYTIARLINKGSTLSFNSGSWKVAFNSRSYGFLSEKATEEPYEGKVYCPTTSTGFFIIKHNDQISITGNSFNYRMAPPTFREDVLKESEGEVALSEHEARRFHSSYHTLFPEISNGWWPELEFQVRKTGYLFNLFGFPCYCQGPFNEKTWRELTSWVPQSTVGCLSAIAVCDVQDYIEENGLEDRWHIVNEKHDSIMIECPDEDAMIAASILKASLNQKLVSPRGEEFFMKSEVCVGKYWSKFDKLKCPEGMKEVEV